MTEYASVKIPRKLADEVDSLIGTTHDGFASRAEITKVALRKFLREYKEAQG